LNIENNNSIIVRDWNCSSNCIKIIWFT